MWVLSPFTLAGIVQSSFPVLLQGLLMQWKDQQHILQFINIHFLPASSKSEETIKQMTINRVDYTESDES